MNIAIIPSRIGCKRIVRNLVQGIDTPEDWNQAKLLFKLMDNSS